MKPILLLSALLIGVKAHALDVKCTTKGSKHTVTISESRTGNRWVEYYINGKAKDAELTVMKFLLNDRTLSFFMYVDGDSAEYAVKAAVRAPGQYRGEFIKGNSSYDVVCLVK